MDGQATGQITELEWGICNEKSGDLKLWKGVAAGTCAGGLTFTFTARLDEALSHPISRLTLGDSGVRDTVIRTPIATVRLSMFVSGQ